MKKTITRKKPSSSKSSAGKKKSSSRKPKSSSRSGKSSPGRSSGRFSDQSKGRKRDFSRSRSSSRSDSRSADNKTQHEITCAKCGSADTVPFKPTGNKPVLCRRCFGKDDRRDSRGYDSKPRARRDFNQSDNNSKQMDELHKKLDKILAILEAE